MIMPALDETAGRERRGQDVDRINKSRNDFFLLSLFYRSFTLLLPFILDDRSTENESPVL